MLKHNAEQFDMALMEKAVQTVQRWPLSRLRPTLDALTTELCDARIDPAGHLRPKLEKLRFEKPYSHPYYLRILDTLHGRSRTQLRRFYLLARLCAALERRAVSKPVQPARSSEQ